MAASVQVLCPNGRRQNVKVTPNTKIIQIIEEVCLKQGYEVNEYGLRHGRGLLDVSAAVRFTNLPNNAKLELVKTEERMISTVTVALQLETGERLLRPCTPDTSLWAVLEAVDNEAGIAGIGQALASTKISNEGKVLQPVCIYMREEIIGQCALEATTLRMLGLLSGSAAMRIIHRHIDPLQLSGIAARMQQFQAKRQRLDTAKQPDQTFTMDASTSHALYSDETMTRTNAMLARTGKSSEVEADPMPLPADVMVDSAQMVALCGTESSHIPSVPPALSIVAAPLSDTLSLTRTSAEHSTEHVSRHDEVLCTVASSIRKPSRPAASANTEEMEEAMDSVVIVSPEGINETAIASVAPQHHGNDSAVPSLCRALTSTGAVDNATVSVISNTETPAALIATSRSPCVRGHKQLPGEAKEDTGTDRHKLRYISDGSLPSDRGVMVYGTDEIHSEQKQKQDDELTDEFFEVTINDIKIMHQDHKRQLRLFEEMPLLTQAQRDALAEEKVSRYKCAIVRFCFPDGNVVQAKFLPKETVHHLKDYVGSLLQNADTGIYLYTAPPKCVLTDDAKTLIQANLVPTCTVFIGTDKAPSGLRLRDDVVAKKQARVLADLSVSSSLPLLLPSNSTLPACDSADSDVPALMLQIKDDGAQLSDPAQRPAEKESKVPKWYKHGK